MPRGKYSSEKRSMKTIAILDYGIGNLKSVYRAFLGLEVKVSVISEYDLKKTQADYLVLPGVGAFKEGMEQLKLRKLDELIYEHCRKERPFLGICLGMQMLACESEEFENTLGLGLIKGKVRKINVRKEDEAVKIPHTGWNSLAFSSGSQEQDPPELFKGMGKTLEFYFIHSYQFEVEKDKGLVAKTHYRDIPITAAIRNGPIWGVQFHPEKSASLGLKLLDNFIQL